MADMGLKLLTVSYSPFGQRVSIALQAKGISHSLMIEDDLTKKSTMLLESNPHKKIPVLFHNGKPLAESFIILEYIEDSWPAGLGECGYSLFPGTPYERAQARFWADFIEKKVTDPMMKMIKAKDSEVDKAAFEEAFSTLDSAISQCAGREGPFFFGKHLSFVDIVFAPLTAWLSSLDTIMGLRIPPSSRAPRLHEWIAALQQHPTIQPVLSDPVAIHEIVVRVRTKNLSLQSSKPDT